MKFEKSDFTIKVLANIVETANYSNNHLLLYADQMDVKKYEVKETWGCQECASVLQKGGKIWYVDTTGYSDNENDSVSHYKNARQHEWKGSLKYSVTLDEFVDHLNDVVAGKWVGGEFNDEDPKMTAQAVILAITNDSTFDAEAAWIVVQAAFFGEIVY